MAKANLPKGFSVEEKRLTCLRQAGKIVLALPTEHCPPRRIQEVIEQISRAR